VVQAGSIGAIWIETVAVKETCFLALDGCFDVGSFRDDEGWLCTRVPPDQLCRNSGLASFGGVHKR